jgi:hypothetical protein
MRETINTSSIIGKGCERRIPIGVGEDVNIKMDLRDIWRETWTVVMCLKMESESGLF